MTPSRRRRVPPAGIPSLALAVVLALLGSALGHATLVLGEISVHPDPPRPGEPFRLVVTLRDPSTAPVEQAVVLVELREQQEATRELPAASTTAPELPAPKAAGMLEETGPARYEGTFELSGARTYHLLVRDQTYAWEETNASLVLSVGGDPVGTLPFLLPPTAVAPRSVWTWLLWLVGLPIAAGLLVTVLVLGASRGARPDEPRPADTADPTRAPRPEDARG